MAKHLLGRFLLSAAASTALAACNSKAGDAPMVASQLTAGLSSQNQSSVVGQTLANPLTVTVSDASGNALAGATVTFTVVSGGGTLSAATVVSDANGGASTFLTLGTTAGIDSVVASAGTGITATFTETAKPDAPAALVQVSGNNMSVIMGDTATVVVRVVDRFGNAVSGVALAWNAGTGAAFADVESLTGSDGTALAVVDVNAVGQLAVTVALATNSTIATTFSLDGT